MASNRHLGRIVALQTLYEYELRLQVGDIDVNIDDILKRNLGRYKEIINDRDFVEQLTKGIIERQSELDEKIAPMAPEWPLDQISRVDRSLLRMGLFELLYSQETVPSKVVINEAVELAKAFGSDNSSKFVNGVLGTAFRTLVEGESANGRTKSK